MNQEVRQQYEKYPYPPIPLLAFPPRHEGKMLRFDRGLNFLENQHYPRIYSHQAGIKILVAGAGSFETLVVAQNHPYAKEIVAVDFSPTSVAMSKRRLWIGRFLGRKFPPVRLVCEDLFKFNEEGFDYILINNVLQHVLEPARLMKHLSTLLKPGGIMRVVTYPFQSRLWMRETARFFKWNGLRLGDQHLLSKCKQLILNLPHGHPIRSCFESNSEVKHENSLIDAFFHPCERPLSPLTWGKTAGSLGLHLFKEDQHEYSRSDFIDELMPSLSTLHPWVKLQILDSFLELCVNPVLWFVKGAVKDFAVSDSLSSETSPELPKNNEIEVPSRVYVEMKRGLLSVEGYLKSQQVNLKEFYLKLKDEVGERVFIKRGKQVPLPGLALTDYPLNDLLTAEDAVWDEHDWRKIVKNLGFQWGRVRLVFTDSHEVINGRDLGEQIEWLQLRFGHVANKLPKIKLENL